MSKQRQQRDRARSRGPAEPSRRFLELLEQLVVEVRANREATEELLDEMRYFREDLSRVGDELNIGQLVKGVVSSAVSRVRRRG